MEIKKNSTQTGIFEAQWDIVDVIFVFLTVIVASVGLLVIFSIFVSDRKSQFVLLSYCFSLLSFFVPYFWLKRKYHITFECIGLKKGRYHFKNQFLIATLAAFAMFGIVVGGFPLFNGVEITKKVFEIKSIIALFIVPFTPTGFANFILTPTGEELLLRGFLYGYLRKKLNLPLAIIIQAIFSTAMHITSIKEVFFSHNFFVQISCLILINVVMGYMYEATKSLYPSMLCHGIYNYLLFIYPIFY